MPSDKFKSTDEERIDQEAAEWFIKRDRGLSSEEAEAYRRWLKADDRHVARIQWHERTWQRFSPIEELDEWEDSLPEQSDSETVKASTAHKNYFRYVTSLAALVLLALSLWGIVRTVNPDDVVEFEGRYVVNAYENRILPDGTILELNKGARIKVRFTDLGRTVWLHEGEVYFHVAKDARRPFVVQAGTTNVKAVGTEFNVRFNREGVQVAVTEGRISLSQSAPIEAKKAQDPVFTQQMDAGQVSTIQAFSQQEIPVVETVTYDQLSELLAWKPKTLEFTSAPLGDVVMAFNKRNDIQIVLADEELETMPIEATFRSDNVLAFTRLLEVTFDLRAERRGRNEIVLSNPTIN